jgi:hypothetical protein
MTVYQTPFDPATRQCTGPSEPTAFDTLADVIALMGAPEHPGRRVHTYTGAGVAFSDFPLYIDKAANSGHHSPHLSEV